MSCDLPDRHLLSPVQPTAENESLKSENDYLKSATGASKTLKSYDC
ncbi:hypothetical protein ACIQCD_24030 [Streptomyces sp. NPDC093250]